MSLVTILLLYLADRDAMASANRHTCSTWRKGGNRGVKRLSLGLLSTSPIDWQRVTLPRHIFLRSQCFIQAATMSWGNEYERVYLFDVDMVYKPMYTLVSLTEWILLNALVAGKWLLYTTAQWPWPSRSDRYCSYIRLKICYCFNWKSKVIQGQIQNFS